LSQLKHFESLLSLLTALSITLSAALTDGLVGRHGNSSTVSPKHGVSVTGQTAQYDQAANQ